MKTLLGPGVALVMAACGNVSSAKVDARIDGPDPDAFSCAAPQLACGTSCVDPQTDNNHCGSCDNACQAVGSTCMAGHCVDTFTSCAQIHQLNPSATTGFYMLHDGTQVYCDMVNVITFDGVGMGQYNVAHAGWELVTLADLQNATMQSVFVTLYNQQGGLKLVDAWTSANCCFRYDPNSNTDLKLQGQIVYPIAVGAAGIECNTPHNAPLYSFQIQTAPAITAPVPMPSNFFTTNPATGVAQCTANNNPAFFWKKHP